MGLMPRFATKNPIHRVPFCSAGTSSLRGMGTNGITRLNFGSTEKRADSPPSKRMKLGNIKHDNFKARG
jgi:hypothetical protein